MSDAAKILAAIQEAIYEITHLSPRRDDGSHACRISAGTLQRLREAASALSTQPLQ